MTPSGTGWLRAIRTKSEPLIGMIVGFPGRMASVLRCREGCLTVLNEHHIGVTVLISFLHPPHCRQASANSIVLGSTSLVRCCPPLRRFKRAEARAHSLQIKSPFDSGPHREESCAVAFNPASFGLKRKRYFVILCPRFK